MVSYVLKKHHCCCWTSRYLVILLLLHLSLAEEDKSFTVEDDKYSSSTVASTSTTTSLLALANCTRCYVWKGDDCFDSRPCLFCNKSVPCINEDFVCRDNICMQDPFDSGSGKKDPLGRVIALIFVTLFMLGLIILCLQLCVKTCRGGSDRRCCIIHCAVSIQCCCEWKAGRLRIFPDTTYVGGAEGHARHNNSSNPTGRRGELHPPPPPAYMEIYPEETPAAAAAAATPPDNSSEEQQQQPMNCYGSCGGGQARTSNASINQWISVQPQSQQQENNNNNSSQQVWTSRQSQYILNHPQTPASDSQRTLNYRPSTVRPGSRLHQLFMNPQDRPLTT